MTKKVYRSAYATRFFLAFILMAMSGFAKAIPFSISWEGAGGYSMSGVFSYDDSLIGTGRIDESDLASFRIEGFLDGASIGSLDYFSDLPFIGLETFNFNFDATSETLFQGGASQGNNGQLWGTRQAGSGCITTGFGFGSGAVNESICRDGSFVGDALLPVRLSTLRAQRAKRVPQPATFALICIGLVFLRIGKFGPGSRYMRN